MSLPEIPAEVQRRFPQFCQRVAQCRNLPRLPDGYVIDAVYTSLDDVPCESYKADYRWGINLFPEAQFTTAMLFFNQELVFAWCNRTVYVDRVPDDFVLSFDCELGREARRQAAYEEAQRQAEYEREEAERQRQAVWDQYEAEAQRQREEQAQKDEEHERLVALDKKNQQILHDVLDRISKEREAERQRTHEFLNQYSSKK
jgi:hypothetical protein